VNDSDLQLERRRVVCAAEVGVRHELPHNWSAKVHRDDVVGLLGVTVVSVALDGSEHISTTDRLEEIGDLFPCKKLLLRLNRVIVHLVTFGNGQQVDKHERRLPRHVDTALRRHEVAHDQQGIAGLDKLLTQLCSLMLKCLSWSRRQVTRNQCS
jgi:hypothetical protein